MVKIFLLASIMLAVFVSPVLSNEVVITAGTELSVTNSSKIDSSTMAIGDEANFVLAADVAGVGIMIPKGSQLLGRVVEVEKADGAAGASRVVIMFDFLKVVEEYYSISAIIKSVTGVEGLKVEKSAEFECATMLQISKGETVIAEGTTFRLKVDNDVTNE